MGREGIHVAFRRDIPGLVPVFWDFPPPFFSSVGEWIGVLEEDRI